MSCGCGKAKARRIPRRAGKLADTALLLDTHVFAWWLGAPEHIAPATHDRIATHRGRLLISVVTIWEMAQKHRRGRWPEVAAIVADPLGQIAAESMTALPVALEHARVAGMLEWGHRDPFDRMLAAQAIVEGAILVTADRAFADFPRDAALRTLQA